MAGTQITPRRPGNRNRLLSGALRIVVTATVASSALVALPAQANATPFPETYRADNARHTWCRAGNPRTWTTDRKGVVAWGMNRLANTTDMSAASERCGIQTDIQWYAWNLPANVRGRSRCAKWVSNRKCDSAVVDLDFPELDKGTDDFYDRRKTALHEIGHTIGLGHHSPRSHNCAMISGEIPSRSSIWLSYHSHDIGHINRAY